ncbi:hypothetical protein [Bacillus sp. CGMCC 1.16541]|uniref:hypothetical protein n=1 Tax=Bacillus sp. CGMCC 1.16541 TaxID=2185143 RepID=UPI000D731878|nr:hypothetical protein [Bacillus sp. CGMCC 1.16541]
MVEITAVEKEKIVELAVASGASDINIHKFTNRSGYMVAITMNDTRKFIELIEAIQENGLSDKEIEFIRVIPGEE